MKTFFTSDNHFGHFKIIEHCNRPFSSLEEMEEKMVERWNGVVTNNDRVYCLGDFGFKNTISAAKHFSRLKGKKILISGNHDNNKIKALRWERVHYDAPMISLGGMQIVLNHYSMRTWNKSHRGSYHLFGHSHGKISTYFRSFDIGVDCWGFSPVELEQVKQFFQQIESVEHKFDFEQRKWMPVENSGNIEI